MRRNLRHSTAFMAMLGLLFAQLSLVACARVSDGGHVPPAASASLHADCAGHAQPAIDGALCGLHCQVSASVPSSPVPDLAGIWAVPLSVANRVEPCVAAPRSAQRIPHDTMATAPPVAIRFCRLLI